MLYFRNRLLVEFLQVMQWFPFLSSGRGGRVAEWQKPEAKLDRRSPLPRNVGEVEREHAREATEPSSPICTKFKK